MTEGLPHIHNPGRTLTVKLPGDVSAKLASYRREMHPTYSDDAVAAYLIRDALIHVGMWNEQDKAIEEGRAPAGSSWKK